MERILLHNVGMAKVLDDGTIKIPANVGMGVPTELTLTPSAVVMLRKQGFDFPAKEIDNLENATRFAKE